MCACRGSITGYDIASGAIQQVNIANDLSVAWAGSVTPFNQPWGPNIHEQVVTGCDPAVAGEIGVLGGVSRDTGSGVGWLMKRGCPSVRLCSGKTGLDRERTPSWHMESFSVCCCKETWFRQSPRRERFKSGTRRGCGRWSQD